MSETHVETKVRNKGQFKKGNPGGPGNPHAKQVARIRATLLAALEPETLYQIVCQLIDRAVRGNLEAIKILLAYAVGRPGKSDNLIELLTDHYPPAQETANENEETEEQPPRTDAQPVEQVADLSKAPTHEPRQQTDQTAHAHRQQTDQTVPSHRPQTDQTAHAHRQQTDQTANARRQQTDQTALARRQQTDQTTHAHRQQTDQTAHAHRQQTDQTAFDPQGMMALIQDVLNSDPSPGLRYSETLG